MNPDFPRYIALCGYPGMGKTSVQKILQDVWCVQPVDDGLALRTIAVEQMGLTWDQVLTQAGKLETVTIAGRDWVVRDLLGQIGNRMEDLLGPHGVPFLSERTVADKPGCFSFGSVRRDQGKFYQERDGVVIGVRNPNVVPSPYEFDRYDATIVDVWIDNMGFSMRQLERATFNAVSEILARRRAIMRAAS